MYRRIISVILEVMFPAFSITLWITFPLATRDGPSPSTIFKSINIPTPLPLPSQLSPPSSPFLSCHLTSSSTSSFSSSPHSNTSHTDRNFEGKSQIRQTCDDPHDGKSPRSPSCLRNRLRCGEKNKLKEERCQFKEGSSGRVVVDGEEGSETRNLTQSSDPKRLNEAVDIEGLRRLLKESRWVKSNS